MVSSNSLLKKLLGTVPQAVLGNKKPIPNEGDGSLEKTRSD
jgi:hypothetical protein